MSSTVQALDTEVCVVGLGYVGLTLATVLADAGISVLGVEIREDYVKLLRAGKAPFYEDGLERKLVRNLTNGTIRIETSIPSGCTATIFILTVGTPLDQAGNVRMDIIERAAADVANRLKSGDMVILRSTVRIGTTRNIVRPILEAAGLDFDLAFCPERTSEGQALAELGWLPQIIGSDFVQTRQRAARLFNYITPTVIHVSAYEVAEFVKLVDNSYRDTMFAFANEVARISDAIGVNAMEVITTANLGYPRTNVLLPGPVGGPCLEKDPHILADSLKPFGIAPGLIIAGRSINEQQPSETVARIEQCAAQLKGFSKTPTISLLGIAFKGKPETDDLRGTMALHILRELRNRFPNATFRGYDAVVKPDAIRQHMDIEPVSSVERAFRDASIIVIANNHPSFTRLPLETLALSMATPGFIYDYWNICKISDIVLPEGIHYASLGGVAQFHQTVRRQVTTWKKS